MKDTKKLIGERIRNKRNEKGIKLESFAEAIDISSSSLSRIENGTKEITVTELEKIAKYLELPIHYFTSEPININQNNFTNNDHASGVYIEQHSASSSYVKKLEQLLIQKDEIISNCQQNIKH